MTLLETLKTNILDAIVGVVIWFIISYISTKTFIFSIICGLFFIPGYFTAVVFEYYVSKIKTESLRVLSYILFYGLALIGFFIMLFKF